MEAEVWCVGSRRNTSFSASAGVSVDVKGSSRVVSLFQRTWVSAPWSGCELDQVFPNTCGCLIYYLQLNQGCHLYHLPCLLLRWTLWDKVVTCPRDARVATCAHTPWNPPLHSPLKHWTGHAVPGLQVLVLPLVCPVGPAGELFRCHSVASMSSDGKKRRLYRKSIAGFSTWRVGKAVLYTQPVTKRQLVQLCSSGAPWSQRSGGVRNILCSSVERRSWMWWRALATHQTLQPTH